MPVSPLEPTPVSEPISRPVCVDVALDVPLRQLFSYTYETAVPAIGARVKVPFGRRKMVGVVVAHGDILPEHYSLKPIDEVLEASAIFEKNLCSSSIGWRLITMRRSVRCGEPPCRRY